VRRAAKTRRRIPRAPSSSSLPVDVLNASRHRSPRHDAGGPGAIRGQVGIEAAADLLVKAERPILISGDAVAHGDGLDEMAEVAELLARPLQRVRASTCSFPSRIASIRAPSRASVLPFASS